MARSKYPDEGHLALFTNRPRMRGDLFVLPGAIRLQFGDDEIAS